MKSTWLERVNKTFQNTSNFQGKTQKTLLLAALMWNVPLSFQIMHTWAAISTAISRVLQSASLDKQQTLVSDSRQVLILEKYIHLFNLQTKYSFTQVHFAAIQAATSFASSFPEVFGTNTSETNKIPALIPCAIE
jgi:hypothetical protein